jgi:hypothetical protein
MVSCGCPNNNGRSLQIEGGSELQAMQMRGVN